MNDQSGHEDLAARAVEVLSGLPQWILSEVSERIRAFNETPATDVTEHQVEELIERITHPYFLLPVPLLPGAKMFRGRHCGAQSTFLRWQDVHYPPDPGMIGPGRANAPHAAVLYCASTHETAFAELRLDRGNRVNIACVEVATGQRCLFSTIGEIDNIRRYGRSHFGLVEYEKTVVKILNALPSQVAMAVRLVDAFFADRFGRKGSPEEYRVTAAIVSELMRAEALEAVAYPSVAHPGGMNWAFRPEVADSKLIYTEFYGIEILQSYGYGMYEGGLYARATSFNEAGNIDWQYPTAGG